MKPNIFATSMLVIAAIALSLAGTASAMEAAKFDSGPIAPGGAFTWHADAVGLWPYYCAFHGGMNGTINVTSGDGMGQVVDVRIEGNALEPRDVTVPLGADIKWTNFDPRNHTVTQGTDAMMGDDGMMDDGMSGTHDSHMDDHDGMMSDGADSPGAGMLLLVAAVALGMVFVSRRR
jgi:plastocyanin